MFRFMMFTACLVLLSACAPTDPMDQPVSSSSTPSPSNNPYAPQPGDSALVRAQFFLDKEGTSILAMESYPVQFTVSLKGSLPTACHQPRIVVNQPDADNKIVLEAYSVVDPNKVCAEMIQMFEANIPLGTFPKGHYSIWVNEEQIGEIDA